MKHIKAVQCVHEGLTEFACALCTSIFNCKANSDNHVVAMHEGLKEFPCSCCTSNFRRKGNLSKNTKAVHEKLAKAVHEGS